MSSFQQQARQAIRDAGGRVTEQRQRIIDLLAGVEDYVDAEQLHQLANVQDANLSLPTVYRTLHTLEEANLITPQYISQEHERKYYRVASDAKQFHFTCRRCGRVIPFQTTLSQKLKDELAAALGVAVASVCMCVDGLCAECRQELETKQLTHQGS